jgi:hypothetical protein
MARNTLAIDVNERDNDNLQKSRFTAVERRCGLQCVPRSVREEPTTLRTAERLGWYLQGETMTLVT